MNLYITVQYSIFKWSNVYVLCFYVIFILKCRLLNLYVEQVEKSTMFWFRFFWFLTVILVFLLLHSKQQQITKLLCDKQETVSIKMLNKRNQLCQCLDCIENGVDFAWTRKQLVFNEFCRNVIGLYGSPPCHLN